MAPLFCETKDNCAGDLSYTISLTSLTPDIYLSSYLCKELTLYAYVRTCIRVCVRVTLLFAWKSHSRCKKQNVSTRSKKEDIAETHVYGCLHLAVNVYDRFLNCRHFSVTVFEDTYVGVIKISLRCIIKVMVCTNCHIWLCYATTSVQMTLPVKI
jgi:hypothetical protein